VLAWRLDVEEASRVSKSLLRTCSHTPVIQQHQGRLQKETTWFSQAFFDQGGPSPQTASVDDVMNLVIAFATAQQINDSTDGHPGSASGLSYVRVRNLRGKMAEICAVLTVMFGASITVGDKHPRFKGDKYASPRYTSILFIYDRERDASVDLIRPGQPIAQHIVKGRAAPSSRITVLEMRDRALNQLRHAGATRDVMVAFTASMDLPFQSDILEARSVRVELNQREANIRTEQSCAPLATTW
jgi:hypothetical protein